MVDIPNWNMSPFHADIHCFLVLTQTLNMTRAAELLGKKQSAVSKSLQRLERDTRVKLFSRSKSGLQLTQDGIRHKQNFEQLADLWGTLARGQTVSSLTGVLSIGAHTAVVVSTFPTFFPQFNESYPGLSIKLETEPSLVVTRKVLSGELDFGFVINPHRHAGLVIRNLKKEFVGIWKAKKTEAPKPVIYFNPEMINVYSHLRNFADLKQTGITDYQAIAAILSESKGLAILPSSMAQDLRLVSKLNEASLCLVYRKDRSQNLVYQTFIKEIRSRFV